MTTKLQLDIPVLLPSIPDEADACVVRLTTTIGAHEGVEKVHVLAATGDEPAKLCVHFDAEQLPLARVRELAQAAGAQLTEQFGHLDLTVTGISHERRARAVAEQLLRARGILEAEVNAAGSVHVEFERSVIDKDGILDLLAKAGATPARSAVPPGAGHSKSDGHDHAHGDDHDHAADKQDAAHVHAAGEPHHHKPGEKHDHDEDGHDHHGGFLGPNTELIFALASGGTLIIGTLLENFVPGTPHWLPLALFLAAYFFGGFFTVREAWENLLRRRFEIDTLMLVAAAGAAALGAFAEGAFLLALFSLGHALEHYAMGRAKKAIEALAELAPATAFRKRGDEVVEVPVEELELGDILVVRPNERLPADGFLTKGTTSINQAPVTGESIPVDKKPVADLEAARAQPDRVDAASRIFAGTINGAGAIEMEVTRKSTDSALAKVVKMVSEAEAQKSPTQRFTEKFEKIFVPAVLLLAFVLLFAWVVIDEPFSESFYRAMAVLVAASPCALAIATPSAVLSGVARAARGGVLVKGGGPLENLGSLQAIAFDKTGTLTEGEPRITDLVTADGVDEKELLSVAVAVEGLSDHPLAQAIVRDGKQRLAGGAVPPAADLKNLIGRGVTAQLDGETVWIGKIEMFGTEGVPALGQTMTAAIAALRDKGRTTMVVRKGQRDLGAIGLMDTPRPAARAALQTLRSIGITRMIMISGDNQKVADAIAKDVGLDEAWGDLMPEDKVEAIKKLRGESKVAMVGDGVNDAPAMAAATVGIAMGAAGSDVALETADVALMADDLRHLPFAVGLSRSTRRIILQNVFVSLGVVAFLVPATIFGLGIGPAVALHEGSTLLVVINALRLLVYKDPRPVA